MPTDPNLEPVYAAIVFFLRFLAGLVLATGSDLLGAAFRAYSALGCPDAAAATTKASQNRSRNTELRAVLLANIVSV